MHHGVFVSLIMVLVSINNINLTNASNEDNTVRYLKGAEASTERNQVLSAVDEERAGWQSLVSKLKGGKLDSLVAKAKAAGGGTKLKEALKKIKAPNGLKNADNAAAAATGKSKWQTSLEKMKANNFKNIDDIKAPAVNQNMWQATVAKIPSGKLNKLDTTNSKWKSAFNKLKTSGKLKNVDEAQVAKVTEGVAKEIAKAPAKSSKFKKFLEITFGVALTALIVIGVNAMVS
ncbi:RxLR effector protein [Phytophthora megakarya]|uniref:RxLR effector protein n=1 Tax=Phytophthora megakarya TaxID=4795 RepID=A0A225VGU0_9STRA|nr:RxLR effector protein [Phytophthora megakarya]